MEYISAFHCDEEYCTKVWQERHHKLHGFDLHGSLLTRRLVNLPRIMLRYMGYVIYVENHELPYGDWLTMVFEAFNVPLIDKQEAEPKRYDFFEETFLSICQLKRENGVWWLENGGIRRRDDEDEATATKVQNEEREETEKEVKIQGEYRLNDKFYDAEVRVEEPADEVPTVPAFPASSADSTTNVQMEQNVSESTP
ncbi:hypothetical protein Dimus_037350 [Dionaea muscipula]